MSNKNQDQALIDAAYDGNLEAAKQALNNGANVNAKDSDGYTPLHCASGEGHMDVVSWLLEKGANVNVTNDNGNTPLHYACSFGQETICSLLLQNGAKNTINAKTISGDTPLHFASYNGNDSICTLLLQNGANPNITNIIGSTPLQRAQYKNNRNCVDVINQFLGQQESRQNAPNVPTAITPSNIPLEKKLTALNKKLGRKVEAAHWAKDLGQDDEVATIYMEIKEIEGQIEEIHDEMDELDMSA